MFNAYLEHSHGVGSNGGMQGRSARTVLRIGLCTGVEEALGGIRTSVACGQVQGSLASFFGGTGKLRSLHEQILDHAGRAVVILAHIFASVQAIPAKRGQH